MKILCRIKKIWLFLFSGANLFKTIYFNFRVMPFQEAIRLPIWLFGKIEIPVCTGNVKWLSSSPHTGGWIIGNDCMRIQDNIRPDVTIIELAGTLILGEHGKIRNGVVLRVYGVTCIEEDVNVGYRCKIICKDKIHIGSLTQISWECQIFDTNFHYYVKDDRMIQRTEGEVYIGSHCWIGNRTSIMKDSYIADGCIVASNSLVNHNLKSSPRCLIAGIPARKVANNCQRLFESEQWQLKTKLDGYFSNNPNNMTYEIS
jgi:acetyltransferase-like isoleucine patch superfamily enzyme